MSIQIIQHQDRTITHGKFDKPEFRDRLLVTSIFRTIQGEGPLAGRPAVFVRLAGCNFGAKTLGFCAFCDTAFEFDKGKLYTYSELINAIVTQEGFLKTDALVITGGEPTLQHNLIPFMQLVQEHVSQIQLETNGTQAQFFRKLDDHDPLDVIFTVVVSPKASSVTGKYPKPSDFVLDIAATCFKFVLTADPNDAHHTVPDWAFNRSLLVYVSPMAVYKREYEGEVSSIWDPTLIDQEATAKNYAYAAQYAMKHGLRLSVQTHLFCALP